ncbi:MAG: Ppx/GppA family phosphatase [Pseudomonadota bacterium]
MAAKRGESDGPGDGRRRASARTAGEPLPAQTIPLEEPDDRPFAVIDIGSNSVRLVVFEGLILNPAPIYNERVTCGLGRGVSANGEMGMQTIERAARALTRFAVAAERLGVGQLRAIATAAVREASDGPVFIETAERILGQPIEVLTGREEARLAALGVRAGIHRPNGIAGDLGGGSLELADIRAKSLGETVTLPLGGLRLAETVGTDLQAAKKLIDRHLAEHEWIKAGQGRPFFAIGGTWRAFARLHMTYRGYPLKILHQYRLSAAETMRFASVLLDRPAPMLEEAQQLSKTRLETLPFGALLLQRIVKRVRPSNIVICATGIREGALFERLPKTVRKHDAFLETCRALNARRARLPAYAEDLCAWTDHVMAVSEIEETDELRRLRHAACYMSELGWRAHPDYRSEQSAAMLENAASTSIDHRGIAFLSLVVYYRHEGAVQEGEASIYRALTSQSIERRAQVIGAALRVAHALSFGQPGSLRKKKLVRDGRYLELHLTARDARVSGERIERRHRALARALGKDARVITAG